MLEEAPPIYLYAVLVIAELILAAMFLGGVREDKPDKFEELRGPEGNYALGVGPLFLALTYILPLDYETWDLSNTTVWIGRALFAVSVLLLLMILWGLVALVRL